jgi:hypothetical protein
MCGRPRIIGMAAMNVIKNIYAHNSDVYLDELQWLLVVHHDVAISIPALEQSFSTWKAYLQRCGTTIVEDPIFMLLDSIGCVTAEIIGLNMQDMLSVQMNRVTELLHYYKCANLINTVRYICNRTYDRDYDKNSVKYKSPYFSPKPMCAGKLRGSTRRIKRDP